MSTEIETRAKALYDECVRLLSDRKPLDPALVESATGGKVTADSSVGNGLEYCKVIVSVIDHISMGSKGDAAAPVKRRGRPKGSPNKTTAPAATAAPRAARTVTVAPKKAAEAKTTRSGRDVTADGSAKAPAKKRGRPKGSKNKPKTEGEPTE